MMHMNGVSTTAAPAIAAGAPRRARPRLMFARCPSCTDQRAGIAADLQRRDALARYSVVAQSCSKTERAKL